MDMRHCDKAQDIGQGSENKGAMLKDKRQGTGEKRDWSRVGKRGQGVRDKDYSEGDKGQGAGGKRDMACIKGQGTHGERQGDKVTREKGKCKGNWD